MSAHDPAAELVEVAIVGAGFAGLAMAIALREQAAALGLAARDVVVLEREADVGGTWLVNRYPGCACDVPSHLYSYSFARNPTWTRAYASQPEILAYIRDVAERHGVREHLRLGCDIVEARWDADALRWLLRAADGRRFAARVLIAAMGGLSRPKWPTLPGMARFGGETLHTARWDRSVALDGRRVAVIGTGASAIQLVPQLVDRVAHLDLYQRTPPWVIARPDGPIASWSRRAMAALPALGWLRRQALRWSADGRTLAFVQFPVLMRLFELACRRHLNAQVPDAALAAKLTPNYRVGCKRVLIASDYYPALTRPNVDVHTGGAVAIDEGGVVGADGRSRPADVVVYATGFEATRPLPQGVVFGPGGVDLAARWGDVPTAYRGTLTHGFPNLFFLVGPNTGLGHTSMLLMIEAQVGYVTRLLGWMRAEGLATLAVRADAEARYNRWLQARLARTVWASGCESWYLSADGRNPTLWPGSTFAFECALRRIQPGDFETTVRSDAPPQETA